MSRYTEDDIFRAAAGLTPYIDVIHANPEELEEMAYAVLECYFDRAPDALRYLSPEGRMRYLELQDYMQLPREVARPGLNTGKRGTLRNVMRRLYSRFLSSSLLS